MDAFSTPAETGTFENDSEAMTVAGFSPSTSDLSVRSPEMDMSSVRGFVAYRLKVCSDSYTPIAVNPEAIVSMFLEQALSGKSIG